MSPYPAEVPAVPPIPSRVRRLGRVLLASIKAWIRHRASSKGAALAFYTLFSMAPILVLAIALAGHVLGTHAARGEIFNQLNGLLSPTTAMAIQSLVMEAHMPGSGRTATWVAFVLLVVGATSVFAELKDSLDDIWQQQAPIPAGFLQIIRTRLLAFALVALLACLFLLSLLANAFIALVNTLWTGALPPEAILSPLFAFGIMVCLFAVINKMLPAARLSWRDAFMGALFTGVLFTLGRRLIGLYLSRTALGSTFGAAGSVAALLIWVYYSAQIFFLGAEFTREYALAFGSLQEHPAPPPKI